MTFKADQQRAKEHEMLRGKGGSGSYRMMTFPVGRVMPTGSIVVGTDINFPPDGPSYASVRAWVPVKDTTGEQ